MKTTCIKIIEPESGDRFTFRRVLVNWHRDGILRTVASSMLEDSAPPEKVAHVLRELATRIERDCRGASHPPGLEFKSHNGPENWAGFVADVNLIDRRLNDGSLPLRYDSKLPEPGPTVPLFEFFGWKVFRR